MASVTNHKNSENGATEPFQLDLSSMVGHEITLYSEQFPGHPLKSKILSTNGNSVMVGRCGGGPVGDLVSNQDLYVQLDYLGQRVSVKAAVKRSSQGKCQLLLDKTVVPLSRRRFQRMPVASRVRLAIVPASALSPAKLDRLRWVETVAHNVSSGGALIEFPSHLSQDMHLFVNLEIEDFAFPPLMMAQVRHSHADDKGRYQTGVEFVVREMRDRFQALAAVHKLPAVVFEYTAERRAQLNEKITALMQGKDKDSV